MLLFFAVLLFFVSIHPEVNLMSQMSEVEKANPKRYLKRPFRSAWLNSLYGKILLPVIGFMLTSMVVTGWYLTMGSGPLPAGYSSKRFNQIPESHPRD